MNGADVHSENDQGNTPFDLDAEGKMYEWHASQSDRKAEDDAKQTAGAIVGRK